MRSASLAKVAIIGGLLFLLTGCSALRVVYGNAQQLAWWWLDGYIDFHGDEVPRAKEAIDRFFEWHRTSQLADYGAALAAAQAQVMQPASPGSVCDWQQRLRDLAEPALVKSLDLGAALVPALGERQFKHLEEKFASNLSDMKRDYLQARTDDRQKATIKRAVERFEQLYGRIGDAQRQVVTAGLAASPFDPDAWVAERERRQKDTVQTLRRLVAERATRDQIVAAMRVLVERTERSPDPLYRAYQQRLAEYNCALMSQIHNSTTTAQRSVARERLKTWEEDLRSFLAPG